MRSFGILSPLLPVNIVSLLAFFPLLTQATQAAIAANNVGFATKHAAIIDEGNSPSRLIAFVVDEAAQDSTDFNGDGDAFDFVLHTYDTTTSTATSLNLAVDPTTLGDEIWRDHICFSNKKLVFAVSEAGEDTDLNSDGDKTDFIVHVHNTVSGQTVNRNVALPPIASDAGGNGIFLKCQDDMATVVVSESAQDADLNSDSDKSDNVLHVIDLSTATISNLGFPLQDSRDVLPGPTKLAAFRVSESAVVQDLNNDGDQDDFIMHVYNGNTQTTKKLNRAVVNPPSVSTQEQRRFRFLDDRVFFVAGENASGGSDFNGDGDSGDRVPHMYHAPTDTLTDFGIDSRRIETGSYLSRDFGGDWVAFAVRESKENQTSSNGKDLNNDGDFDDVIVHGYHVPSGTKVNCEAALSATGGDTATDPLVVSGDFVAFAAGESAQGNSDLNGDSDTLDNVVHVCEFDTASPDLNNLSVATAAGVLNGYYQMAGGLMVFRAKESADGATDYNGDGDTTDDVFMVYNTSTKAILNSQLAGFRSRVSVKGSEAQVLMWADEGVQGEDLNGDGDTAGDDVPHRYSITTGVENIGIGMGGSGGTIAWQQKAGLLVFRADEAEDGNTDYNNDGDSNDLVVHYIAL